MSEKKEQDRHIQAAYENALRKDVMKLKARIAELEAFIAEAADYIPSWEFDKHPNITKPV